MINDQLIEKNFTYHPPRSSKEVQTYANLRNLAKGLAYAFADAAPGSRELSLALTKLEEAVMWANAAIARNGLRFPEPEGPTDCSPAPQEPSK